ncbi:MAG: hypothetical protein HKL92_01835 [Candidatus Eremiobacteraeota bacterium]|nr:hypothetical protein [Candidatus Eremiobacteraeota bacterium]NNM92063.1 hypothetical protein [Candidatus Eremiobacteraeota bacterium]
MRRTSLRTATTVAWILAYAASLVPARAADIGRIDESRALRLLNAQSCSRIVAEHYAPPKNLLAQAAPSPSPSSSPAARPTPISFQLPSTIPTPPAVPTPTPNPSTLAAPVYLVRGGATPPPIPRAGHGLPTPQPIPTGVPTLAPNQIAILADKVKGNTNLGNPGDATGNVHIFFGQDELIGEHAHYDGIRTITVTGKPYIINHAHDSILNAKTIVFDTIDQTAKLIGGSGESSEGVQHGLVYFRSPDLHTDSKGVGHGTKAFVTTCDNPRAGYHITGKTITYYPGSKIVIVDAILWLGAAAVFFLPRIVIPLRQVINQTQRPSYFPEVGYDQYEGAWVKTQLGFGKNRYYYGYYTLNYYTKVGLGLGYNGTFAKKNGRRNGTLAFYEIRDRRSQTSTYNLQANETENFSQRLRANFGYSYQSAFGPLVNAPPSTSMQIAFAHQGTHAQQNYSFSRSAVGSQSSSDSLAFSDSRQINAQVSNSFNYTQASTQSSFSGTNSSNVTGHVTNTTTFNERSYNSTITFDRSYTQQPSGDYKLPEIQIRPNRFFPHFLVPLSAQFYIGQYSEPTNHFATQRADMSFVAGPALYNIYGSTFSATVNVQQYAYGTGDLKAQIQQNLSLTSPIGKHIVNAITYNESNFNGPGSVPFQFLDQFSPFNNKGAQDVLRLFNGNVYTLQLGFSTNFNALAQPVSYQFTSQPSPRSYVQLGGSFVPGIGQGFTPTQVQFSTPFGRGSSLQFSGLLDWKNHARIEDKSIYYSHIIGNCYELRVQYLEPSRSVNVSIDLLAFPSQAASFGIGQSGPILPTSFNGISSL